MVLRTITAAAGIVGFLLFSPAPGVAAEKQFPVKPIQVIIPFQPGETDNLLRPFIEKMPEYLGQPVSFVYKPGAAGTIGAGFVAGSKPDGYTLVGTSQSSICLLPVTNKDAGYTRESFAPVSCLALGYLMIAVQSSARWNTIQELVAEAKKNPGKINYASTGTLGISHIAGEAFGRAADIKLNHIPAQGSGPAVTALLGGHVDFAVPGSGPSVPHIRAGTMRALIVFNEKRVKALAQVPTSSESGYPVVLPLSYGLLAPKGTPKEIVEVIAQAAQKVVDNHKAFLEDRLFKVGAEVGFMGPQEHGILLKSQSEYFEKIMKGIK